MGISVQYYTQIGFPRSGLVPVNQIMVNTPRHNHRQLDQLYKSHLPMQKLTSLDPLLLCCGHVLCVLSELH